MSESANLIIEDLFTITAVDQDGRKFDKVSRVEGHGSVHDLHMVVDMNVDVYPIVKDETYTVALAHNIELDSTEPADGSWDPTVYQRATLMDKYDYVMFGRVYGCSTEDTTRVDATVYVSYGGLLMKLKGPARDLREIRYGQQLYFLMRKAVRTG
eukprot:PhM_4_TR536/c0_g1_i1/m.94655/K03016/RPB8, POLR2H; DNA-directed RNA polymerases I, II, and III subunit RPABC3